MSGCPWSRGSRRRRFYRPDWASAPDCEGCHDCRPGHRCHVFGLPDTCRWPTGITQSNYRHPWWWPDVDAGLAESWLPGVAMLLVTVPWDAVAGFLTGMAGHL